MQKNPAPHNASRFRNQLFINYFQSVTWKNTIAIDKG